MHLELTKEQEEVIKTILSGYKNLKSKIRLIQKDIEFYESSVEDGMRGIDYNGVIISPTFKIVSLVESTVIKKHDIIERLKKDLKLYRHMAEKIELAIDELPRDERKILKLYYMGPEPLTWRHISRICNISTGHTKGYMQSKALSILYRKLIHKDVDLELYERIVNR